MSLTTLENPVWNDGPPDMMIDFETLAVVENAHVLSLGAVLFDPGFRDSRRLRRYTVFFSDSQRRLGREIDPATLLWWLDTNPRMLSTLMRDAASTNATPDPEYGAFQTGEGSLRTKEHVTEIAGNLRTWALAKGYSPEKSRLWSRGNLDLGVLHNLCLVGGVRPFWPYHRARDVRSTLEALGYTSRPTLPKDGVQHDPITDCEAQIATLRESGYRRMTRWESEGNN